MIIHMKALVIVNDFGNKEEFPMVVVENFLSEHLYRCSPYESADTCGNCNGAKCDTCHTYYKVTEYSEPVTTDEGYWKQSINKWRIFKNEKDATEYFMEITK